MSWTGVLTVLLVFQRVICVPVKIPTDDKTVGLDDLGEDFCDLSPELGFSGNAKYIQDCESLRLVNIPKPANVEQRAGIQSVICCPRNVKDNAICFPSDPFCPSYSPPKYDGEYEYDEDNYDNIDENEVLLSNTEKNCMGFPGSTCTSFSSCDIFEKLNLTPSTFNDKTTICGFDTENADFKICCPQASIQAPRAPESPRFPVNGKPRKCEDLTDLCQRWSSNGACDLDKSFATSELEPDAYGTRVSSVDMFAFTMKTCMLSCNRCGTKGCVDEDPKCGLWAREGECVRNPFIMTHMCRESCGVCGFLSTLNEETQNFEGKSYSRIDDANFDCGRYKSFDYLESIGLNVTREDKNEGTTKTPVQPEADDFSNEFDLRNTAGDNDDPNDLSFANSNENAEIFCTASLISDKWMLTAGHCSDRIDNNFGEQKKIQTQTIRSLIPDLKEYVEVRNVYIHPEYRSNELHGDVALLELGRRVEFKPNVYGDTPLCLDNRIPLEGRTATGQGYGLTEDGNQGNLLEANVTIIGTTDCIDELDAYLTDKERKKEKFCETMPLGVSDEQLCVKGIKKGDVITAACKGDSGGPLFLQDDDGLRTLVGIVSGSLSCEGRAPEWYSRIKYFRDWITCIMDRTPADNYNKARVEKACKSAGARKTGGPTSDFCPKNI